MSIACFSGEVLDDYEHNYFEGYSIYLHEKGHFWPSTEMGRLGQIKAASLMPKTEQKCSFQVTEKTSLDKPSARCLSHPAYSFTTCMLSYIQTSVGCRLDWFHSAVQESVPICTEKKDLLAYNAKLNWVAKSSWIELSNSSACLSPCSVRQFSVTECQETVLVTDI